VTESLNIKSKLIPKIATGFCGGISHTDGMCGAILGGILCINTVNGRNNIDDDRDANNTMVRELINDINQNFGSTRCYELTGCDLSTETGQQKFEKTNANQICNNLVAYATHTTLEFLKK
jgi:C_GCAxxG_C_C family probable redox protein